MQVPTPARHTQESYAQVQQAHSRRRSARRARRPVRRQRERRRPERVGHVDKGDVQSALKWNNSDFDKGVDSLKFTAGFTATYDNVLTCGANAGDKVVHVPSTSTGTGDLKATPVKSSNGKQITGWNLTGGTAIEKGSNDLNKVMQATFTACLPDKPYSEMTAEELRRLPVKIDIAKEATVNFDGLKVNDIALPNTPVAATA